MPPVPAAAARASPSDRPRGFGALPRDVSSGRRNARAAPQFHGNASALQPRGNGMTRAASLLFSLVAYAIFFATFLYLIAFVGDIPIAGQTVDRGPDAPLATAVLIDVALIALFGVQHSVMARQGFKR